jgi:hypothetical protein
VDIGKRWLAKRQRAKRTTQAALPLFADGGVRMPGDFQRLGRVALLERRDDVGKLDSLFV